MIPLPPLVVSDATFGSLFNPKGSTRPLFGHSSIGNGLQVEPVSLHEQYINGVLGHQLAFLMAFTAASRGDQRP